MPIYRLFQRGIIKIKFLNMNNNPKGYLSSNQTCAVRRIGGIVEAVAEQGLPNDFRS